MKILYVANMRIPTEKAHGYQILQMCQSFIENKVDLTLLVPWRRNPKELREVKSVKEYYNLRVDVPYQKVFAIDFLFLFAWISKFYVKIQFILNLLHLGSFAVSLIVKLFLSSSKDTIIYIRDLNLFSLIRPLLQLRGYKFALELHAFSEVDARFKRQMRILKQADYSVVMTGAMRDLVRPHDQELADKIIVSHDAVDLTGFEVDDDQLKAREKLNLPKEKRILSYIGKFHTNGMEKGIPEIIKSSSKVLADRDDVLYYFVGGPLDREKKYRAMIDEIGMDQSRFVFMEKRPVAEVPYFLKASNVLLMPHPKNFFYSYCVSPLKLFEYMSSKRPIIGSKLPTISEILRNEENALLAEAGNHDEVAEATIKLLDNPELVEKVTTQAYEEVLEYTWFNRARDLIKSLQA